MSAATLLDTVREAAGRLRPEISDARKLRVLCPRGHFIVELAVITLRDGLVLTSAVDGLEHAGFAAELAELADAAPHRAPRGATEWVRQSDDRIGGYTRGDVVLECPRQKCDPRRNRAYRGSFEYYSFSAELGEIAQRHTEHRLIN